MQFITDGLKCYKVKTGMTSILRGSSEHEESNTDGPSSSSLSKWKKATWNFWKIIFQLPQQPIVWKPVFWSVLISLKYFFCK